MKILNFREFLRSKNCLQKYIDNYKIMNNSVTPYKSSKFIHDAFHWKETPEGFSFWQSLDKLWQEYLSDEEYHHAEFGIYDITDTDPIEDFFHRIK